VLPSGPSPACCDDRVRSRNICYAHALASALPEMLGVIRTIIAGIWVAFVQECQQ